MYPARVSFGGYKCECTCHDKQYRHDGNKECCIVCDYCGIRIKEENYSMHRLCHEAAEEDVK